MTQLQNVEFLAFVIIRVVRMEYAKSLHNSSGFEKLPRAMEPENSKNNSFNWTASSEFGTYRLCEQRRLRIRAGSPEPSQLAHTSSESKGTFRQKSRSLAPLNGWACAVKICHDGMLEDTNSLDGAQLYCFGSGFQFNRKRCLFCNLDRAFEKAELDQDFGHPI